MMKSSETKLGMKWYNFLVCFGLFAGALMNVGDGVMYLTGGVYLRASSGQMTAEEVYALYGAGLRVLDVIFGILAIAQAVLAIMLWWKLFKRKEDVITFVWLYYGIPIVTRLIYTSILSGIISTSLGSTDIMSFFVGVLILALNVKYFSKREHLFIQVNQNNLIKEKNTTVNNTTYTNANNRKETGIPQKAETDFLMNFGKELKKNDDKFSVETIVKNFARVKYGAEFTPLFIAIDGMRVTLYEKDGTTEKRLLTDLCGLVKMEIWIAEITKRCKKEIPLVPKGKALYQLGQVWEGDSYVDLVNKIFHQNYKQYLFSTVKLNSFGVDGIAWIVCIDGKPHGRDGDLWINRLIDNGNIIEEEYVGVNKYKIRQEFLNPNYRTFADRLTFQKDPSNTGDNYKAKCLGFYTLKSYDVDQLIRVWERKKDSVLLTIRE